MLARNQTGGTVPGRKAPVGSLVRLIAVILRSPTRQSRCGDGASGATRDLPSSDEQILRFAQSLPEQESIG